MDAPTVLAARTSTTRRARRYAGSHLGLMLVYLFLVVLAAFCVIPLLWVLLSSVDPLAGVHSRCRQAGIDLSNYTRFLSDPQFTGSWSTA